MVKETVHKEPVALEPNSSEKEKRLHYFLTYLYFIFSIYCHLSIKTHRSGRSSLYFRTLIRSNLFLRLGFYLVEFRWQFGISD